MEYASAGRFLATSHCDGTVNFWKSEDMTLHDSLMTFNPITLTKASPSRNLIALCDSNSQLSIYNLQSMKQTRSFYHSTKQISSIAFSAQSYFAAACDDSTVKLWSLDSHSDQS